MLTKVLEKYRESPMFQGFPLWLFCKYIISGFSSAAIQYGLLIYFIGSLGFDPTISSGISFLVSCVVNYLMLYYWAFQSRGGHGQSLFRYFVFSTLTLGVNVSIFWILTEVLGMWYLYSQSIAICMVGLVNFVLYNRYTFRIS